MSLPPLSKVRCCRPKKFERLPEGLSLHHPFQNRTITLAFRTAIVCMCLYGFAFKLSHLAFRRASVCVCLVGFASLQSLWAHTFKASLPCLPLPLHQTSLSPRPLQKNDNPSLAPTLLKTSLSLENRQHPCLMNALLALRPAKPLGVQLRASMPVPCQR